MGQNTDMVPDPRPWGRPASAVRGAARGLGPGQKACGDCAASTQAVEKRQRGAFSFRQREEDGDEKSLVVSGE